MKIHSIIRLSLVVALFTFCFAQCKKEHTSVKQMPLNIVLYDKPLSVIRTHIQGKWKLHYGKGGIIANTIRYYNASFWEFSDNRVKVTFEGNMITDTTIMWYRDRGTFTHGDSTFIMKYYDKWGYPTDLIVDSLYNDTLILHNYAADAVFYHFTKL